jgi:hypothetical protein
MNGTPPRLVAPAQGHLLWDHLEWHPEAPPLQTTCPACFGHLFVPLFSWAISARPCTDPTHCPLPGARLHQSLLGPRWLGPDDFPIATLPLPCPTCSSPLYFCGGEFQPMRYRAWLLAPRWAS